MLECKEEYKKKEVKKAKNNKIWSQTDEKINGACHQDLNIGIFLPSSGNTEKYTIFMNYYFCRISFCDLQKCQKTGTF